MSGSTPVPASDFPAPLAAAFRRLEEFDGEPAVFWPELAKFLATLCGASEVTLAAVPPGATPPAPLPLLARTPGARLGQAPLNTLLAAAPAEATAPYWADTEDRWNATVAVFAFETGTPALACTAVIVWPTLLPAVARARLGELLALLSPLPARFLNRRNGVIRDADLAWLGEVLALLLELQAQTRFRAAALLAANFIADQFPRSEVALGWTHGSYVRVVALAKRPEFDRKLEAIEELESVLEECLGQDNELICPPPPAAGDAPAPLLHHHDQLRRRTGAAQIVSVPLRHEGRLVGAFTLQLPEASLDAQILRRLRVLADQITPPLVNQHAHDGSWFTQFRRLTRERLRRHWNVEHPWAKVGALAGCLLLILLAVIPAPHRVETPFRLQARAQALIPAPFDGYVRAVQAETAAVVTQGEVLAELDTTELAFDRARTLAELSRARAEAENARGEDRLAAVRIAQAQADQARASLALTEQRLANARLTAPFAAVVVDDSDLAMKLGSPVRAGDPLYRLAQLDRLIVDLQADERDFPYLRTGLSGEIAFASRPGETFPIRVVTIEPLATAGETGNTFLLRAEPTTAGAAWWRPGMTGVAKLDVGHRSLLWLLTHRALDWLRLKLWW